MNPHLQRLQLLRPFAPRLCAALCVMAVTVGIQLVYPRALSYFIDNVNTHRSSEWYTGLALTMLAILTAQAAASTLRYYLFETTGYMIVTRARRLLYGALMHKPIGFYDKHNVGELTSRLSADADVLHDTLSTGLPIALRSLLIFIGGTAMLLAISPSLSLVLVLFVPATILLAKWGGKSLRSLSGDIQGSQAECGKVANEHFANIRLVRAFNQHRTAIARYFTASERSLQVAMSSTRMFAAFRGMSSMLVYLALLATLWLGAGMIGRGELTIGELTAFLVYANMVSESAGAVSDAWSDWMRTIGATERVFEMMGDAGSASNASDAADKSGAASAGRLAGHIHFSGVSFHYPERPERRALDNVSFTVDVGEKIALVGPSGAGKSTIAAMLLGFYAPGSGKISFDGVDAAALGGTAVRANIAIVEQEPSLFSGSIYENIAFAVADREASRDEVERAARAAHAHDFIAAFPNGYDTIVGDRGVQLSGGQKQRVAIARALLRNPAILILDEATSALDSASELQVQQALDRLMEGRTTIIIAHRYSTIVKADRILVLDQGRVVQQDSHRELMQHEAGLYYQLMEHQLSPA
jgi:ATP-binding cassette, subfamily B, bacterial